jgi:hypothetical protein
VLSSSLLFFCLSSGSVQSDSWVSVVPSKKRTYVTRPTKQSAVEKLTQDLHLIMDEEHMSHLLPSDDDLLYPEFDSFETGYGSVLIRNINSNLNSETVEEESEASSVLLNSKCVAPTVTSSFSGSIVQPDIMKRYKFQELRVLICVPKYSHGWTFLDYTSINSLAPK